METTNYATNYYAPILGFDDEEPVRDPGPSRPRGKASHVVSKGSDDDDEELSPHRRTREILIPTQLPRPHRETRQGLSRYRVVPAG